MTRHNIVIYVMLAVGLITFNVSRQREAIGQENLDAARKWTQGDRDKGYVVFNYSTLKNLPHSQIPSPGNVLQMVSCVLARDEYESVQIGVYAVDENMKDIQLKVESDLKVTVYHRIQPAIKNQLGALYEEGNGIARWMQSEVHLQRGDVFDELPAGQSVNFWLTFRADIETQAGLHRGKIRIKPAGMPETVLELEVTVRSFELDRPRAVFGIWMREDMLPKHIGGVSAPRETVLAIYKDMAEHGHNSSWFYPAGSFDPLPPKNNHAFDKLIPLAQQAGLLDPDVPSLLCNSPVDLSTEEQRQAAVAWVEAECRKRGLPEMIAFGPDEPKYPQDDILVKSFLRNSHNLSMRVNLDLSEAGRYGFGGDMCDVFTVHDGMISPEMVAEAGRTGTELWTYSYRMWRERFDPVAQRYFSGFYTWTHKLRGNWMWAYHHGHHRHAWFAPGSHEPMPVTGYEARREGIDDYRYLQMVEDCVAVNPDKPVSREAGKWLKDLRSRLVTTVPIQVEGGKPLTIAEYDEIRERAAAYIEKLGPVPAKTIVRPSVEHAKDEAAPYRGKPVEECITGLGSRDASERRAAALALYELGPKAAAAVVPLARALDDPEVRMPALHALNAIGLEAFRAVPQIAKLLEHPDFYVRIGAIVSLGEIGCPLDKRDRSGRRSPSKWASAVIDPMVIALSDDCASLSYRAAEMLSAMGHLGKSAVASAILMLDDSSPTRRNAAIGLITCLGPHAQAAVPRLVELHRTWDSKHLSALAAIGPAAISAIDALEQHARTNLGTRRTDLLQALFCIRGDDSDLREMVELLKDANSNAATKQHVMMCLNQLGARAEPVADEIRGMLKSGEFVDWEQSPRAFLKEVEKGTVPGISFEW